MKAPLLLFVGTQSDDITAVREALREFALVAIERQIPIWTPYEPAVSPLLCRIVADWAKGDHRGQALKIFCSADGSSPQPGGLADKSGYATVTALDPGSSYCAAVFIGSGGDLCHWWTKTGAAKRNARMFPIASTGADCRTFLGEAGGRVGNMLRFDLVYSHIAAHILPQ